MVVVATDVDTMVVGAVCCTVVVGRALVDDVPTITGVVDDVSASNVVNTIVSVAVVLVENVDVVNSVVTIVVGSVDVLTSGVSAAVVGSVDIDVGVSATVVGSVDVLTGV